MWKMGKGNGKGMGKMKGNGKGWGGGGCVVGGGCWPWMGMTALRDAAAGRPVLQSDFARAVDGAYEKLLDLNVSQSHVAQQLQRLVAMRGKLQAAEGGGAGGGWSAPVAWSPPAAAGGICTEQPSEFSWKSKLNEVIGKKFRRQLAKGDVVYTVHEDPEGKFFTCTVSSSTVFERAAEYTSKKHVDSKRQAEHEAAKVAINAEFREFLPKTALSPAVGGAEKKGAKRKADPLRPLSFGDHKSELLHYVQLLLGRSSTKEDLIYSTEELGEGSYQSTVSLPTYEDRAFTGEVSASKRDAEMSAAAEAVRELGPLAAPLVEEHRAKKLQKLQEAKQKRQKQDGETGIAA